MHDAIHLSDLHLGSDLCNIPALEQFLGNLPPTRRLILGGDVLEATDHRLRKKHWHILSMLRKLADDLEIIWVRGNHDHDAEAVAHLIGATWCPYYTYQSGETLICTIHGDQWDNFIRNRPILTWLADRTYLFTQRLWPSLASHLKLSSKTYLRCAARVREKAIKWGKSQEVDVVICGHTHHPHYSPGQYVNTGCWTDDTPHYAMSKEGKIFLFRFEPT